MYTPRGKKRKLIDGQRITHNYLFSMKDTPGLRERTRALTPFLFSRTTQGTEFWWQREASNPNMESLFKVHFQTVFLEKFPMIDV